MEIKKQNLNLIFLENLKYNKKNNLILYRIARAIRKNRKKTFDKYVINARLYERKLLVRDYYVMYNTSINKIKIYCNFLKFFIFFIKSYMYYNGKKKIKNSRKLSTLLKSSRIMKKFYTYF